MRKIELRMFYLYLFNKEIRNYIKNTCQKCSFYKNSKRFHFETICNKKDIKECKKTGEIIRRNKNVKID